MGHPGAIDLLVVEDAPHERELTLRAFRDKGRDLNVFAVKDGEEALDFIFSKGAYAHRAAEAPPRLVLLDLKLPKINGLEVLRRIKADEKTRTIPVVMLTSSQDAGDIAESYRLGANSYMVKPMDFSEFTRCISTIGEYWFNCSRLPN